MGVAEPSAIEKQTEKEADRNRKKQAGRFTKGAVCVKGSVHDHILLKTAAAAWIFAGGAHHTVYSQNLTSEHIMDYAGMAGVEFLLIDTDTRLREFRNEIRWNEVYYQIRGI